MSSGCTRDEEEGHDMKLGSIIWIVILTMVAVTLNDHHDPEVASSAGGNVEISSSVSQVAEGGTWEGTVEFPVEESFSATSIGWSNTAGPNDVHFDGQNLWAFHVGNQGDYIDKIDPATGVVEFSITTGREPSHADFDPAELIDVADGTTPHTEGIFWVSNLRNANVKKVDVDSGAVVATVGVGSEPNGVFLTTSEVWVANTASGTVSRIDRSTNAVIETITVGDSPVHAIEANGYMWFSKRFAGTVAVIDVSPNPGTQPSTVVEDVVVSNPVGGGGNPFYMDFDGVSVWVPNNTDGTVVRVDASTRIATGVFSGNPPNNPSYPGPETNPEFALWDGQHVWISFASDVNTVLRIDPSDDSTSFIDVGARGFGLAHGDGNIWLGAFFDHQILRLDTVIGGRNLAVDWGDGTSSEYLDVTSPVDVSHTYVDDNPTGTPSDSYDIIASVETVADSGERIVFATGRHGPGNNELYWVKPDGTDEQRILGSAAHEYSPDISPDGTQLAYVSIRDGNPEIYVSDITASGLTNTVRITNHGADDNDPSWSPDGSQIAFSTNRSGNYDVWVVDLANPATPEQFTFTGGWDSRPSWSPDGLNIAFDCQPFPADICVLEVATKNVQYRFPHITGSNYLNPQWSPDGTTIAFMVDFLGGNTDVYVGDASNGLNQVNLTGNPAFDSGQKWSPDGTKLAFFSNRDGDQEIYVMDAQSGAVLQQVTTDPGGDGQPDWGFIPAFETSGSVESDPFEVTVDNVAPVITSFVCDGLVAFGNAATCRVDFTDVGTEDTRTGRFIWDLGTAVTATETGGSGFVEDSFVFGVPGVHNVTVEVEDDDLGTVLSTTQQILVAPTEIMATADSILRSGKPHHNEGANELLFIRSSGPNRSIVSFDLSDVPTANVAAATLVFTIDDSTPPAQWGQDGRESIVKRVLEPWTEGDGKTLDLPPSESTRGTGAGTTWKCGIDTDISNQAKDCPVNWKGASESTATETAPPVVITNGQSGEISFDVTADIVAGADFGWLLLKDVEGQSGHARFYSKEGALAAGDLSLAPTLQIQYSN